MAIKRALGTFAVGRYTELLDIVRPTYQHYAERHGYEYVEADVAAFANDRPPAWWRVPILQELVKEYDEILYFGSDMIVVDSSEDIADHIPDWAIQALVIHRAPPGNVPNCDVWWLRPEMAPYLDEIWELDQYMNHPWWEQAALSHVMGYDPSKFPLKKVRDAELYDRTHFLPLEWNSHESLDRHPAPRFAQATHGTLEWRKEVLTKYREIADCP